MKEVQGSVWWLLLSLLDIVVLFPKLSKIISHFQTGSEVSDGIWVPAFLILVVLVVLLSRWFFPAWRYGDDGIETCYFWGKPLRRYGWNEVIHIDIWVGGYARRSYIPGSYEIRMKDGAAVSFNVLFTKDFSEIMKDIVPRVLRGNLEAYVAPGAMQWAELKDEERA